MHYIGLVGRRHCWPALRRPCLSGGGVLTLTDPRSGHFFKLALPVLLTLSDPRGEVLTLTDPQSGVLTLTDPRNGHFFKLTDSDPVGRPTGPCRPTDRAEKADVVFTHAANSWLAVWLSGNALVLINVVTLRWARLVHGWVTVFGRVNYLGM